MKKQNTNWQSTGLKSLLMAFILFTFVGLTMAQTYQIQVKADGRYLHEDGYGDKLVSTRYQPNDDFTKFIFQRQYDGSYRIKVKASGRYLHDDGGGDRLLSTRYQPFDDFAKFILDRQNDGSYLIRVKATGRYLHEDGLGDRLLSTRYQANDNYSRFYLRPVQNNNGSTKIRFINQTNSTVSIYWVDRGREKFYSNLTAANAYTQQTYVNHQWRIRLNGKLIGTVYGSNVNTHNVQIISQAVNAGPIWNQQDANAKCNQLAYRQGSKWTGGWWTTVQGRMSVCELAKVVSVRR
jgi:hypothetical protein